ncbi:MAG TPA: DNA repair protein RadC, partial [Thiotrichales bacterium]|nr:DNA repair protein RadC [Thiotrichales bacterium]
EMARRHLYERLKRGDALCSVQQTRQYLSTQLQDCPQEIFACLFLDNRNRVISFEKMFFGTIDCASVYPREVVRIALKKKAAAVILAHNHPSGVAEPSRADEQITQRLKDALALVDIRVLDHFVVGDEVVSFAERGLL